MNGNRRRLLLWSLACLLIFLAAAGPGQARPGDIDSGFGTDGKVVTDFGKDDDVAALALQPDGKMIAAGKSCDKTPNAEFCTFALARYNLDGSLDNGGSDDLTPGDSFGNSGKVLTDLAPGKPEFDVDEVSSLALQPDGKIIAAGASCGRGTAIPCNFALARYEPDGSLDRTFGAGGVVLTEGGYNAGFRDVALQTDGKIVAVGKWTPETKIYDFYAVVRYTTAGVPDPLFKSGGSPNEYSRPGFINEFFSFHSSALAVAIHQGKITVTGHMQEDGQSMKMRVTRYLVGNGTNDGMRDPEFRILDSDPLGFNVGTDLAILENDGSVLVSGEKAGNMALARLTPSGTIDHEFNVSSSTADFGGDADSPIAMAVQKDSRIILSGKRSFLSPSTNRDRVALARFNEGGGLDAEFGSGGQVRPDLEGAGTAVAIDAACRPVVAVKGAVDPGDFVLLRYQNQGPGCESDLAVEIQDQPDPVAVGETLTYTATVSNNSTLSAERVILRDDLPAGVEPRSVSSTVGSCGPATRNVVCQLGTLAPGEKAVVQIGVVPSAPGVFLNSASVQSSTPDPNLANNQAAASTTAFRPDELPPPRAEVHGLSPSCAAEAGGTPVTVSGRNLAQATAVRFGDSAAVIGRKTETEIVAVTPSLSRGRHDVVVTTAAGSAQSAATLEVPCPAAPLPPVPRQSATPLSGRALENSLKPPPPTPPAATGTPPSPDLAFLSAPVSQSAPGTVPSGGYAESPGYMADGSESSAGLSVRNPQIGPAWGNEPDPAQPAPKYLMVRPVAFQSSALFCGGMALILWMGFGTVGVYRDRKSHRPCPQLAC